VERLAPEEDSVHYHLADAYRKLGRTKEADAELAKFRQLAKKKSAITQVAARRQIEMTRDVTRRRTSIPLGIPFIIKLPPFALSNAATAIERDSGGTQPERKIALACKRLESHDAFFVQPNEQASLSCLQIP
jgi:hypothetical protein